MNKFWKYLMISKGGIHVVDWISNFPTVYTRVSTTEFALCPDFVRQLADLVMPETRGQYSLPSQTCAGLRYRSPQQRRTTGNYEKSAFM